MSVDSTMDEGEEEFDEEQVGGRRLGGKKIVLFIVLPILLVVGGLGGSYFAGLFGSGEEQAAGEHGEAVEEKKEARDVVFYDLPEMLVNLSGRGRRASFLKIQIALELDSKDAIPQIEAVMPRIIDNFQVYLRELRVEDLDGAAGVYRLKEELLARVAKAVLPVKVRDVLFKEMLVQ